MTLHGVLPVVPTPFDDRGEVDESLVKKWTNRLVESGAGGIVGLGATSEALSLSREEWSRIGRLVVDEVGGRVPVVLGALAYATRDVVSLAKEAEDLGAAAVLVTHPYFGGVRKNEVQNHYGVVADALKIPVVLYNNPGATGTDLSAKEIVSLANAHNVRYVKESSGDPTRVNELLRLGADKITVLAGIDRYAMDSIIQGAQGWISGNANLMPEDCVNLFKALTVDGDLETALGIWKRIQPVASTVGKSEAWIQLLKQGIRHQGLDCGTFRLPLLDPDNAELEEVKRHLDRL